MSEPRETPRPPAGEPAGAAGDAPPAAPRAPWFARTDATSAGRFLLALAAIGFALGGLEAVAIRGQLAKAGAHVLAAPVYHQVLTLHGVSMLFLALLPAAMGCALLLLPARLGGDGIEWPRLSAFGAWLWASGALVLHFGIAIVGTSEGGMLGNASMVASAWSPRATTGVGPWEFELSGVDWWASGLGLMALAAALVTLTLFATVLRRRAPGKPMGDLPPFAWNTFLASGLGLLAFPTLFAGLVMLEMDRLLGTAVFVADSGGDPGRWARVTALLGHPQVAMLLLPAMGLATEVVAASAGRPMVGRPFLRIGSLVIALAGALAWLAQVSPAGSAWVLALFPLAGALMALAASSTVFHWLGTLWGRPLSTTPALLFVLGMAALLMIGAFGALPLALQPAAARQVGTYFGVAHAHEMLFGGALLGFVAGLYQMGPRLVGRALDAGLGRWHFALTLVGALLTFLPMHALGLAGMPRRIHTYGEKLGWGPLNALSSAGAIVLLVAGVLFALALVRGRRATPPPTPGGAAPAAPPSPSAAPALFALGLGVAAAGMQLGWAVGSVGGLLVLLGVWRSMGDTGS